MSGNAPALGLGIAGAGGFAEFINAAVANLQSVRLAAITDADHGRAARPATATGVTACRWEKPPANPNVRRDRGGHSPGHARGTGHRGAAVRQARALREPPATTLEDADAVRAAVRATGRGLDHVLRYNPLLHLLGVLRADGTLGPAQRFLTRIDFGTAQINAS
jgi:predicted dehydrogenase